MDLIVTLLLQIIPVPTDWNEWAHSVCAADVSIIEPGVYGLDFPNSWTPSWGEDGWGTINLARWPNPAGAVATVGVAA